MRINARYHHNNALETKFIHTNGTHRISHYIVMPSALFLFMISCLIKKCINSIDVSNITQTMMSMLLAAVYVYVSFLLYFNLLWLKKKTTIQILRHNNVVCSSDVGV